MLAVSARAVVAAALVAPGGGRRRPAAAAPAASAQTAAPDPVAIVLAQSRAGAGVGEPRRVRRALRRAAWPRSASASTPTTCCARASSKPWSRSANGRRSRACHRATASARVAEFFIATPGRGRVLTVGIDVRRPAGGDLQSWRIVGFESLSSVDGLYKLRLNTTTQFAARNLVVRSEDLELALEDGTVFQVECDDGVTGLVLLGRGVMRFAPTPAAERGQLRIFSGSETLAAAFETAFVRLSPSDFGRRVVKDGLTEQPVDARLAQARAERLRARIRQVVQRGPAGDEPRARGTCCRRPTTSWPRWTPTGSTRSRSRGRRRRPRTSACSSATSGAPSRSIRRSRRSRRAAGSTATTRRATTTSWTTTSTCRWCRTGMYLEGRARLAMRVRSTSLSNVMLRLADTLTVRSVTSVEYGPLLHLRVRSQNVGARQPAARGARRIPS